MPEGHLVTAEELERMGERGHLFELVRGELLPVNPPGGEHGALAVAIAAELWTFVRARGLGRVYTESGYVLSRGPDTVRGPDVSFVSRERETAAGLRRGFLQAAPDRGGDLVAGQFDAQPEGEGAGIPGGDVVPGFTLPLSRLFAALD